MASPAAWISRSWWPEVERLGRLGRVLLIIQIYSDCGVMTIVVVQRDRICVVIPPPPTLATKLSACFLL